MLLAWVAGLARAGVTVRDDSACIDEEALDIEVRAILGDAAVDALDVSVVHVAEPGGERVEVEVARGPRAVLWTRSLPIGRADCPLLPPVLARSIEAGLEALPGWRQVRHPPEAAVYGLGTGATGAPRFGMGSGGRVWLGGRVRLEVDAELFASTADHIVRHEYALAGAGVAAGPSVRVGGGALAVDLGARAWGGVLVLSSPEFGFGPRPHAFAVADAICALGGIRAGPRLEIPLSRQEFFLGFGSREERELEPAVRVGVVVGLGGALVRRSNPTIR